MDSKYIAWDGEEYEWPPPVGWVQESDGRWWPNEQQAETTNPYRRKNNIIYQQPI